MEQTKNLQTPINFVDDPKKKPIKNQIIHELILLIVDPILLVYVLICFLIILKRIQGRIR